LANSDSSYNNIRTNVNNLKIIQLGITLGDGQGRFPQYASTWQFNFKFDLQKDPFSHESIQILEEAGIDFIKFNHEGIDVDYFAENFISSGIVLNDNLRWITFHGAYDLAYLLKNLSNQLLPEEESCFFEDLSIYFPNYFDLRYMIRKQIWLKGSLSRIAADLDVDRIGVCHQAGSDSLITSKVFYRLMEHYGECINIIEDRNKLFGFDYKNSINENKAITNRPLQTSSNHSFYHFAQNKTNLFYTPTYNNYQVNPQNMVYPSNYNNNYQNPNPNSYEYGYYSSYMPSYGNKK
jgi:CCR4-NOT transcription complex subunit 7/8